MSVKNKVYDNTNLCLLEKFVIGLIQELQYVKTALISEVKIELDFESLSNESLFVIIFKVNSVF